MTSRLDVRHLILIAAAVALLAIGFKPQVSADGGGYFSYLHSIVFDHDLNMTDEYQAAMAEHIRMPDDLTPLTITSVPSNRFSIGPALLSLPAYLVAALLNPGGTPQFSPPFSTAYTLASLFYGLIALALAYRLLRRLEYTAEASGIAIAAIALTTPLSYYIVYSPSYSHTFSAFVVTLFVYVWWTGREQRTWKGWVVLGFIGGLMALVRWQDGPLMAITLLDLPQARWRLLFMAPGTLLAFSPQLIVDQVIFGHWQPGAPAVAFEPFPGHYLDVLFSSLHGLFVWSPMLLAAVAGYWWVKDKSIRAAFAICFVMQVAIIGAFVYWYGGFAFGMRFLINLTPFFAIGLAAVATRIRPLVSWVAIAVLACWNFVLMLSFTYTIKEDVAPGYFGLVEDQFHSLSLLPHLVQGYVARGIFDPLLHRGGDVPGALAMLLFQTVIVTVAVLFGSVADDARTRRNAQRLAG